MTPSPKTRYLHVANGTGTTRLIQAAGIPGSISLTETGRAVLAGRQDRVAICGIDRWLGGVHLQTDASIWRWDEARQRIVAP